MILAVLTMTLNLKYNQRKLMHTGIRILSMTSYFFLLSPSRVHSDTIVKLLHYFIAHNGEEAFNLVQLLNYLSHYNYRSQVSRFPLILPVIIIK